MTKLGDLVEIHPHPVPKNVTLGEGYDPIYGFIVDMNDGCNYKIKTSKGEFFCQELGEVLAESWAGFVPEDIEEEWEKYQTDTYGYGEEDWNW